MSEADKQTDVQQALIASARLLQQDEPKAAERLLEPLFADQPKNVDIAINLGGAYILQRKWRKAVAVLSAAAEANPENAMLWTNLAAAELGRLELAGPQHQARAIAAYERALEADPKAPNVHYQLGLIYKERGDLTDAAAMFQRALEVNPADRDAQIWLNRVTGAMAEAERKDADSGQPNPASDGETERGTGKAA